MKEGKEMIIYHINFTIFSGKVSIEFWIENENCQVPVSLIGFQ